MDRKGQRRVLGLLSLVVVLALPSSAAPSATEGRSRLEEPPATSVVRLLVPGRAALDAIADAGFDLGHNADRVPSGFEVDAVVTADEIAALENRGARILGPGEEFQWPVPDAASRRAALRLAAASEPGPLDGIADVVKVGRVDYFTTKGQGFISVEAKTSAADAPTANLVLLWGSDPSTPAGIGGATAMTAFVDSGEYMYHRVLTPVDARPDKVRVVSTMGGDATGFVSDWLEPVDSLLDDDQYQSSFIADYMNPTQLYDRIEALAREHPDLAEIVTLPHASNGYRRKAQATLGSADSAVVVTSQAWGHEGGNDLTVELVAGAGTGGIHVEIVGTAIRVHLAGGSTAADVVAALNAQAGELVRAHTYRGSAGSGAVIAAEPVALTDFLQAPAEVTRDPFPIRALRIGRHRDGSKTGVLIIAQDHAREWVPPVIALEAAERLLANADSNPETQRILDNVDVFIVPSNNPDGAHYSFFDASQQRRNMTNHCADNNSDPGRRNAWGVDLNRNYRVGSAHDGYSGGSLSCTSDTFAGPEELSEPETQNVIAVVEQNPNIKFFMTIHSNGGQLFWQPGAYIAEGRVTTPRPEMRDEAFYWQMAERILSHVKSYQDTVVRPDMVGGSADVLYSSAGNVREDLYFNYGIYSFGWEVGGSVWDPTTRTWVDGSFQPPWSQGYGETMEYANGVMEMFRIAADFGDDTQRPTTALVPGQGTYAEPVGVRFELSEPATVYYTTDGSRPTLASSRYQSSGIREGGETLQVDQTTTFRWFSVDPAGNVEGGYDPNDPRTAPQEATITIG